jgi:hypothetical protein
MKYTLEIGSGAMIYIPCFTKTGSGVQKLMREIHRHQYDLVSQLLFFQIKEGRLKIHSLLLFLTIRTGYEHSFCYVYYYYYYLVGWDLTPIRSLCRSPRFV